MNTQIMSFINSLKISYKSRRPFVKVKLTHGNLKLSNFFYRKNWIKKYYSNKNQLIIYLRYINNQPLIQNILIKSTKGCRIYWSNKNLKWQINGYARSGIVILHTKYGLLTGSEALTLGIGGEVSFIVYF